MPTARWQSLSPQYVGSGRGPCMLLGSSLQIVRPSDDKNLGAQLAAHPRDLYLVHLPPLRPDPYLSPIYWPITTKFTSVDRKCTVH